MALAPFVILEHERASGSFDLVLYDGDMEEVEEIFHAWNAEGHGHGWEGLAQSVVRSRMPEIIGRLNFGSEAGTFVANSSDLGALLRLAAVLHEAFHDHTLLGELIRDADPDLLHG